MDNLKTIYKDKTTRFSTHRNSVKRVEKQFNNWHHSKDSKELDAFVSKERINDALYTVNNGSGENSCIIRVTYLQSFVLSITKW